MEGKKESPEISPHTYDQLTDRMPRTHNKKKKVPSINHAGRTGYTHAKE